MGSASGGSVERISVLVADDEVELLKVYLDCLSSAGFKVCSAKDGREAVTRFIEIRPEVVILDYRMPNGDGIEAAGEILAMKPSTKIIMLTADETVLDEAERIGIEVFLQKPVSLKKLLASVLTLSEIKPASAIVSR